MIYESIQKTLFPRDNRQGFVADQFNPNFADNYPDNTVANKWIDGMLNNQFQFSNSIETPMGYGVLKLNQQGAVDVNHNPMVSHGLNIGVIPINIGYTASNHQYFGGSSIQNVAMFNNNGMAATQAFDGGSGMVTPGSVLGSVGQSYSMGFPVLVNDVQPGFLGGTMYNNTQGLNCGTYLRPRGYMPRQLPVNDHSNGFKISRVGSCEPVQGQPFVVEESGICGPATFGMVSRKRKYHSGNESLSAVNYPFEPVNIEAKRQKYQLEPTSNYGYWDGSGTLMDVLTNTYLPVDLPPLVQWPDRSEDASGPIVVNYGPNGKKESSQLGPDIYSGTLMDVYNSFMMASASRNDAMPDSEDASGPIAMGNGLDGKEESSQLGPDVFSGTLMDAYNSFMASASRKDVMPNSEDALGPIENGPEVEAKIPDATGPKVMCILNSALDDYESVLESELTSPQIAPVDHNGPEVEAANINKPSVTLAADSFEDKGPEVEATNVNKPSVTLAADLFEDNGSESGFKNINKPSASLASSFSVAQIKEHLSSFIQSKNDMSGKTRPSESQNPCQLCSKYKLLLAPTPIYCSSCDMRIKRNVKYYWSTDENNKQHYICVGCFKGSRGSTVVTGGCSVSKANLQMAKNNEEIEDSWVQCDTCQQWQHRICGLYNNETDLEGKAEYVCPKCCLKQMESGTRISLPETAPRAKDLPRTNLSDHIEQRLFTRMKQERQETAKSQGIASEKVPVAEGLVVRVVVSVDKELEVKKEFRDIFNGQDYPEKMEYRSKLILLFQKTGGVDVCLFGMYVQEFGSECDGPNNRCVYISYIDSVKYFQPERKTAAGESLRTFVYHEILIGYLEHCKNRGFASCYIWSCPLIKGEDYIFYCHPKTQKTPEKIKLRQWYKLMIKKAMKDGIAIDHTNLYNEFLITSGVKISAARLPYFAGDCWSAAAENISKKLDEEESSGERLLIKSRTKRILLANGQECITKDDLVMHKLGEVILPDKENCMIVRLQHVCTSCSEVILSGCIWFCNKCNKIQLCSRCVAPGRVYKCSSCKETPLSEDVLSHKPVNTKENDEVLVNKFFETRDDFLNKCQNSLYQFDTLAHAKYSSMMILYHFKHNLVVQPQGDTCHTRNLIPVSTEATPEIRKEQLVSTQATTETRKEQPQTKQVDTLKRALGALIHACQCKSVDGCYPDCKTVKMLLQHISICTRNKQSGCNACRGARWILKNHINTCKETSCTVPYCTDIRRNRAAHRRNG